VSSVACCFLWHRLCRTAGFRRLLGGCDISRSRGEDGIAELSCLRRWSAFKAMHTYVPFQRLLAKIKKETESYRREFGKTW